MPKATISLRPSGDSLQPLGFLPTRAYWANAGLGATRTTLMVVAASTAPTLASLLVPMPGAVGFIVGALVAATLTITIAFLGLGLVERWAKRKARP